jgi:hypothetical protein
MIPKFQVANIWLDIVGPVGPPSSSFEHPINNVDANITRNKRFLLFIMY